MRKLSRPYLWGEIRSLSVPEENVARPFFNIHDINAHRHPISYGDIIEKGRETAYRIIEVVGHFMTFLNIAFCKFFQVPPTYNPSPKKD
jgi:hypothetical protein